MKNEEWVADGDAQTNAVADGDAQITQILN